MHVEECKWEIDQEPSPESDMVKMMITPAVIVKAISSPPGDNQCAFFYGDYPLPVSFFMIMNASYWLHELVRVCSLFDAMIEIFGTILAYYLWFLGWFLYNFMYSVVGGITLCAKEPNKTNEEPWALFSLAGSNWDGAKLSHARNNLPKQSWMDNCSFFSIMPIFYPFY